MAEGYEITALGPNGYISFSADNKAQAIEVAEFLLAANGDVDVEISPNI